MTTTTTCLSTMIRARLRYVRMRSVSGVSGVSLSLLYLGLAACSGADAFAERKEASSGAEAIFMRSTTVDTRAQDARDLRPTGAPAPAPRRSDQHKVSKFLGKHDRTMVDGTTACYIHFVYAGEEAQDTVWEEPCAKVGAGMIRRDRLEALGWWDKLDEFQRGYVNKMPGGLVLFIEGSFSAAIYPIDETGTATEVTVVD